MCEETCHNNLTALFLRLISCFFRTLGNCTITTSAAHQENIMEVLRLQLIRKAMLSYYIIQFGSKLTAFFKIAQCQYLNNEIEFNFRTLYQ